MGTRYPEVFAALAAEFGGDVKVRKHDGARYITARTAANRLDDVLGPENWEPVLSPWREHAVKCRLTITLPDGTKITKEAIGANTTMAAKQGGKADPGEDDKGGDSDSFKRAAAMFGVGRYLYNDGVPDYGAQATVAAPSRPPAAEPAEDTRSKARKLCEWAERQGHAERLHGLAKRNHGCDPIDLTDAQADALYQVLVAATTKSPKPAQPAGAKNENGNPVKFGWPRSGSALYAWCKTMEEAFKASIVKVVDAAFCNEQMGYSRLWKEWQPEQVETAAVHVARLVKGFDGYDGQFDDKVPDVQQLKDRIWEAAAKLLVNLGEQHPTSNAINQTIATHAAPLADKHGGEVLNNIEFCDNPALLTDVAKSIEADLIDARAF